jgi:hypothetical protein
MRSNLARASSPATYGWPALSVRERADAVRYEESLGDFIAAAWHHASEPQRFQTNWHIDCVSDHLMAVARREIKGPPSLRSCARFLTAHMTTKSMPHRPRFVPSPVIAQ